MIVAVPAVLSGFSPCSAALGSTWIPLTLFAGQEEKHSPPLHRGEVGHFFVLINDSVGQGQQRKSLRMPSGTLLLTARASLRLCRTQCRNGLWGLSSPTLRREAAARGLWTFWGPKMPQNAALLLLGTLYSSGRPVQSSVAWIFSDLPAHPWVCAGLGLKFCALTVGVSSTDHSGTYI